MLIAEWGQIFKHISQKRHFSFSTIAAETGMGNCSNAKSLIIDGRIIPASLYACFDSFSGL